MGRHRRRLVRLAGGAAAVAAVTLFGGSTALAHVTIVEAEHEAGAYTLLTFGVPHGCDGSPTTEVRIQMPESIPLVTPTVNPGWDIEKVMEELDTPIEAGHGEEITERVSEVVYTAKTPLLDGYRDALVLSLQIPEDAAGETIYFPVVQTCRQGETPWIEIPEPGQDAEELEHPAPSIAVVAPAEDGGDGESGITDDTTAGATTPATSAGADMTAPPATTVAAAAESASGDNPSGEADDDDEDDGDSNGLSIAALVVGAAGLGVGGTALARQRRR